MLFTCKKCGYSLDGLPPDQFGLVACPECFLVQLPSVTRSRGVYYWIPLGWGLLLNLILWIVVVSTDDGWRQMAVVFLFIPGASVATAVLGTIASGIVLSRREPDLRFSPQTELLVMAFFLSLLVNLISGEAGAWVMTRIHPGYGC